MLRMTVLKTAFYCLIVLHHFSKADVDEGHSEWDYVLCMQKEGSRVAEPIGVQYNAEVVEYSCMENYLYFATERQNLDGVQTNWLNDLYRKFQEEVTLAQRGERPVRERKEYRMLSGEELERFNRALNSFKADRSSTFGALMSLHVGPPSRAAHRGPAFLPWNRIFLDLFELALREYESDVTLPYWDCTLDSMLEQPTDSLMWTAELVGNGNGRVVTGPFANWGFPQRGLMRNIGQAGRLMTTADVSRILDRTQKLNLSDITFPNAAFRNNLEIHSYGVRLWVGGDMALLETATNDPMYFLLHAYIDSIWQQFRDIQESWNINPQTDYATRFDGYAAHFPNARIGVIPNIGNRQGLRDVYGKLMYTYVQPACSPNGISCGSTGGLRCNSDTTRCEAVASDQSTGGYCEGNSGYQNSYCLDGNCDERDWVYLPIEIIFTRHEDFVYPPKTFDSRSQMSPYDAYSSARFEPNSDYDRVRDWTKVFPAPQYEDCRCPNSETGRVYVQSYGLDYDGTYREYAIADKRMPISSVWTAVAVKDPRDAPLFHVRAIIRVYDDCGRICRAACRVPGQDTLDACSGVVIVSTSAPRQYGDTLEDAYYIVLDYTDGSRYPTKKRDLTFLKFYCDYSSLWPWLVFGYIRDPYKDPPNPPTDPDREDLLTTTTTTTLAPTTTTVTTTTTTQPTTTILIEPKYCFNETLCYKDHEKTNCTRCEHHTFTYCFDNCEKFMHCSRGKWYIWGCGTGLLWDDTLKTCNYAWYVDCRPGVICPRCRQPRVTRRPQRPRRPG